MMARLVHPRGDLHMSIQGIDVKGNMLRIKGQMGVWNAQILLSPEEVAAMVSSLLKPGLIGYMILLPWKLRRGRGRERD